MDIRTPYVQHDLRCACTEYACVRSTSPNTTQHPSSNPSISCFISQTQKTFARRFAPCLELPYHEQPGSARAGHPSPCPYPPPIIRIEAATLGPPSPPLFPADVGGAQKTSGTTSARSCNRQCVGRKKDAARGTVTSRRYLPYEVALQGVVAKRTKNRLLQEACLWCLCGTKRTASHARYAYAHDLLVSSFFAALHVAERKQASKRASEQGAITSAVTKKTP